MVRLSFSRCVLASRKTLHLLVSCLICATFAPSTRAFQSPATLTRSSRPNIPVRIESTSFRQQTHLCSLSLPDLEHYDVSTSTDEKTTIIPTCAVGVDGMVEPSSPTVETPTSDTETLYTPPPLILRGQVLVVIAAAMYGTNFPCVKLLDQIVPSALSAALRFSFAAVAVGGAVMLSEQGKPRNVDRIPSMLRGMEVGAWYAVGYMSQALALQHAEAGKVCSRQPF